jgi:hypothetical protein
MPEDAEIVETAAEAAENVIFSRCNNSAVADFDVTVTFEDEMLEVDVYLNVDDPTVDEKRIADDAALAARSAVDDLFDD